jgi:hypothetical protein
MESIFIVGDLHIRKEQPFLAAVQNFIIFLINLIPEGSVLILLGDVFHTSKPFPVENAVFMNLLSMCKSKNIRVVVLQGNHDYNGNQNTYSMLPFEDDIVLMDRPQIKEIEGINFSFLPWMSSSDVKDITNGDTSSLKEFYSEWLPKQGEDWSADYLLYHFPDETVDFGGEKNGIDLSSYKGRRMGGDIHVKSPNYVGTPYQTRYDERGQISRIFCINGKDVSEIEVPTFLNFFDIDMSIEEEKIPSLFHEHPQSVWTFTNVPSYSYLKEEYSNLHIRKYSLLDTGITHSSEYEEQTLSDMESMLEEFMKKKDTPKHTINYINELFGGVA